MTVARMPSTRIQPAQAAADTINASVLWEARIPPGAWTHLLTVLSVSPVTTDEPWGGDIWVRNVRTGGSTTAVHVTSPKRHLVITWAFDTAATEGDLIVVEARPSDPTSAIWVDSTIFTLSDGDLGASPTPSDPVHIPIPPGFDEALFDEDTFT